MTEADTTEDWADRLHKLATEEDIPGAALAVWADGRQSVAAHGVLNAATEVAATPDSLFQIGSITKLWTATMIMQLIDEGQLSLDTTVGQAVPGVRLGPDATKTEDAEAEGAEAEITIRHLLTHTSGIDGDIFADTGRGADCLERYTADLAEVARIFPPGAAYSYCNSGFVLLGRIIEVLDGREWDESLRERLIRPLGLARTFTLPEEAISHRVATGHRERPHHDQPVSVWGLPRSIGPAGNITASAADVLAFARMHLDGGLSPDGTRLLSAASVAAMQQPQIELPGLGDRADAVGLAWRLNRWSGGRVIGHDGGTIGQSAFLRADPRSGVAACLLTNSPEADGLFRRLFSEIFEDYAGTTMPAGPKPVAGPPAADLRRHEGRYERISRRHDVSVRDGRLHVVSSMTGDRAALGDDTSGEEFDLYPADSSGDAFLGRLRDDQAWNTLIFGRLAGTTRYMYVGGRITPRVG
jgi:CubicO group peptidase (beta-lactamase class C family)